jgi:SnoaL-like domain
MVERIPSSLSGPPVVGADRRVVRDRPSARGAAAAMNHGIGAAPAGDAAAPAKPVAHGSEKLVVRWVEAFNARDLTAMLACLAEEVDFHPLRLAGVLGCYRGHDGVREWLATLEQLGHDHQIVLDDVRDLGDGRVLASGSLNLGGERDVGPFAAVDRVDGGLIVAACHYLSDPDTIERIGLLG